MIRGMVTKFLSAIVPDIVSTSDEVYKYGTDNLLPNKLLGYLSDSGVGIRSANKLAEYIISTGFITEASANFKVNESQTANELLTEQSKYFSSLNAIAFHVSRKGGAVYSVKAVPVQCVRKKTNGTFIFNETLGQTKYDKSKDKIYPAYYGETLPINLITDKSYANGELLYVYIKSPLNTHYAVPDYYSQIEDVRTSAELAKFDLETVYNGFVTSALISLVGDIDATTQDYTGQTELDYVVNDFKKFTGQIKDGDGLSGRNKAWLYFAKTKDEVPNVQQFDTKSILEASNNKRDVIERSVCRLFGVHPVLLGYSDAAVLGNTQALSNASIELNKVAQKYKELLTGAFIKLYPKMVWNINDYMPVNYISSELLDRMTEDEIRAKLLNLPPKEIPVSDETELLIRRINSLSPLVANKVLEQLNTDEVRALIGLKKTTTDGAAN